MSENNYVVLTSEQAEKLNHEFHAKTNTNRRAGLEAFRSATIIGFAGYSRSRMNAEYEFKLEYTLPSQREIMERTVEPLREISESLGISQFYPYDSELAPHTTLDVKTFTGISDQEQKQITEELDESPTLESVAQLLKGKQFSFDGILAGGRDTYIYVSNFTHDIEPFYIARLMIEAEIGRSVSTGRSGQTGLISRFSYMDILHSTIGRMSPPPSDSRLLLQSYGVKIEEQIGVSLQRIPLRVEVDYLYYGSALDYHISHASPQLLN